MYVSTFISYLIETIEQYDRNVKHLTINTDGSITVEVPDGSMFEIQVYAANVVEPEEP